MGFGLGCMVGVIALWSIAAGGAFIVLGVLAMVRAERRHSGPGCAVTA